MRAKVGLLFVVALLAAVSGCSEDTGEGVGISFDAVVADGKTAGDAVHPDVRTPDEGAPVDVAVCEAACFGKSCGPDGCGGRCGECPDGTACDGSQCIGACLGECGKAECGDNGCGGTCGVCAAGQSCEGHKCAGSTSCKSILDCALACGGSLGECTEKCAATSGGAADDAVFALSKCLVGACGPTPSAACFSKAAGGECAKLFGVCVACTPSCKGASCGPDGCGGACGQCGAGSACEGGQCVETCLPKCGGAKCGPDGCGGVCGLCDGGGWCENGACNAACTPNCGGKQCGGDGCGGTCGSCQPGSTCAATGKCTTAVTKTCIEVVECMKSCNIGGECQDKCLAGASEAAKDAFQALGACIAGVCGPNPDGGCASKAANGPCAQQLKSCGGGGCVPQCIGPSGNKKQCGGDGCGGTCGQCGAGQKCKDDGTCGGPCVPKCDGKECGSNGCGGSCGSCQATESCEAGHCFGALSCLGLISCYQDCPPPKMMCFEQCLPDGTKVAQEEFSALLECVQAACPPGSGPGCTDKAIGGKCLNQFNSCSKCEPTCKGVTCGGDGCGGLCGICLPGSACEGGQCVKSCTPKCAGKQCGPDGCGGHCGQCPEGAKCNQGTCDGGCKPNCNTPFGPKECGGDGCGGQCGYCKDGYKCSPSGQCFGGCQPQCYPGQQCGEDGCGGSCGYCPPGLACDGWSCYESGMSCSEAFSCMQSCGNDPSCQQKCFYAASPEAQQLFKMMVQCIEAVCGANAGPECAEKALFGKCLPYYEECVGGTTCQPQCWSANGQIMECGDDGCGGACGECWGGGTCQNGQCIANNGPSCAELVYCSLGCKPGDLGCIQSCASEGDGTAQAKFWDVAQCALQVCGFGGQPECYKVALESKCAKQWMECQAP